LSNFLLGFSVEDIEKYVPNTQRQIQQELMRIITTGTASPIIDDLFEKRRTAISLIQALQEELGMFK